VPSAGAFGDPALVAAFFGAAVLVAVTFGGSDLDGQCVEYAAAVETRAVPSLPSGLATEPVGGRERGFGVLRAAADGGAPSVQRSAPNTPPAVETPPAASDSPGRQDSDGAGAFFLR